MRLRPLPRTRPYSFECVEGVFPRIRLRDPVRATHQAAKESPRVGVRSGARGLKRFSARPVLGAFFLYPSGRYK